MVTLRGARMYGFLDRLVNVAISAHPDFRGVSNRAFDGRGSLQPRRQGRCIFPEIEYDKIDALRRDRHRHQHLGNSGEARALLTAFRFPFRQEQQVKPQEQQKG